MNANDIVMNYIAAWNERDPAKRRATVAWPGRQTALTSIRIARPQGSMKSTPCWQSPKPLFPAIRFD
jgi:hypothetical protein